MKNEIRTYMNLVESMHLAISDHRLRSVKASMMPEVKIKEISNEHTINGVIYGFSPSRETAAEYFGMKIIRSGYKARIIGNIEGMIQVLIADRPENEK